MKKFHGLKLLGLVFILAFAFVFIGFNLVQGQVKIQKGKPPHAGDQKYTWSVVILDGPASGIKGIGESTFIPEAKQKGWSFSDSDPNVNVRIETSFSRRSKLYITVFSFEIFYPAQVDFEVKPIYAKLYDNPDALCKYPEDIFSKEPWSMFNFMQDSHHPHPSYDKVSFRFYTDRSPIQEEVDFTRWPNDYHYRYLDFSTNISGSVPYQPASVPCEEYDVFEYSNIRFGGSWLGDWHGEGDYGYFERNGEDVWKVVVGMEKDPDYDYTDGPGIGDDAWVEDSYDICMTSNANKKKTYSQTGYVNSVFGNMDIKYEILFIRTKI